ncbi:MAG: ABC transporter permease subunit [Chloroflexi bacterium]|nr:ABC transporter permease subunit [Chloroflexota bacterium]MCI0576396.1 ABC transporter permease subunit [Chloroflexota bacterium]MCI0644268.1 ABC transporter permease subunit [Chloroflexota bacterium]MCI0726251.1 ABC transporter permease subunit [Chloroflexota bacterium]
MEKIKTIVGKEWAEVFKNRLVLFTVAFLPLTFVTLPFITLITTANLEEEEITSGTFAGEMPGEALKIFCEGISDGDCIQLYLLGTFTMLFMILPVMIPVTIAAYSIVGEKTMRSLEPLLATPITTIELLLGKMAAAVIPAVLATWLGYAIYAVGVRFLSNDVVFGRFMDPWWLAGVLFVGPLLSLLSVCVAIIVSSRVSDPRVAEQLAGVVVLPVIALLLGQSLGLLVFNRQLVVVVALVLVLLDVALIYLAEKTFQRETILTRWK